MNAAVTFQIGLNESARAIRGKFTFAGAWESCCRMRTEVILLTKYIAVHPTAVSENFSRKAKVKVTRCNFKGNLEWIMHAKYEVSISYSSKVIAKVKVDNRQAEKQTKKQTDRSFDPGHKNQKSKLCRKMTYQIFFRLK